MTGRIGQQFGNYQLVRLLGRGGFAEVYQGEHMRLHTSVAIKVLRTQLQEEEATAFLDEAQTIAHLEHPHIIRVLDFDIAEGVPFLVMSYAPGGTLRERHKRGRCVPLALVVSYVKEIAEALQYAHDEKVIHRDVKPENMLLGRRGEVVLTDFGIATLARSSYSMQTQNIAGTLSYMAPEQIQAHPRPASDQYALAVVVYEWLCGMCPFGGAYYELMSKHIGTPPPPLRSSTQILPDKIEQVVLTALSKNPKQRFDTVRTFALELEKASKNEDTFFMGMQYDSSSTISKENKHRSDTLRAENILKPEVQQLGISNTFDYNMYNRLPISVSAPERRSPKSDQKNILGRRRMMTLLATGGVIVAGSTLAVITNSSHFSIPSTKTQTSGLHTVSSPSGKTTTQPTQPKQNKTVIGTKNQAPNSAKAFKNTVDDMNSLLVRLADGMFVAYESACTHQQVPVNYDPATQKFICPLHGSIFDPAQNGKVLQGPALAPLLPVRLSVNEDGTVTIA